LSLAAVSPIAGKMAGQSCPLQRYIYLQSKLRSAALLFTSEAIEKLIQPDPPGCFHAELFCLFLSIV
jgi:hypothetical protein